MKRITIAAAVFAATVLPAPPLLAQAERIVPAPMQGIYDGFHYAPAVRAGDFLYLSGVVGVPRSEGEAGLREAAEQAFTTAAVVLGEAGYSFDDVIDMTSFHTDLEAQKASFQEVRDRFLSEPWPAWTAIDIDRLWMPEAVVEVRFVAWKEGAAAAGNGPLPPGTFAGPYAAVEERLAGGGWRLPFEVVSEGAFAAELTGEIAVGPGGEATLRAKGTFGGRPVDHALASDGTEVVVTTPEGRRTLPAPPFLGDALTVGLVRMGVLHNLARLVGGQLPDHAEGGVRTWVRLREAPGDGSEGIGAALRVLNVPSGRATLQVGDDGLPLRRTQTVEFATGRMTVEERYGSLAGR
jgi:enamine deaminase RidA (YjgF/YER057c/UK114 family)